MANIVFENNGFTLEQKFNGKEFKSFIYFDSVTNKIGYFNNINYVSLILFIVFSIISILSFNNSGFRITLLIYIAVSACFLYDFIINKKIIKH